MSEFCKIESTTTEITLLKDGNPNGLSLFERLRSGELNNDNIQRAIGIVAVGNCIKLVDWEYSDNCFDGRPVGETITLDADGNTLTNQIEDISNSERYKLAGGGYISGLAIKAGLGEFGSHIDSDMSDLMHSLSKDNIFCGTHGGSHSGGEKSDCGANDNIRLILENGVKHQAAIKRSTFELLNAIGVKADDDSLDDIFENWGNITNKDDYFEGSTGKLRHDNVKEFITTKHTDNEMDDNSIVSTNLVGDHHESLVVFTNGKGITFSQAEFKNQQDKIGIDESVQTFAVDIERIEEIAKSVADSNGSDYTQAFLAGLAFQFATLSTLTDGSLRTFLTQQNI